MKATQTTTHRVELSPADMQAVVTAALPTLAAASVHWMGDRHGAVWMAWQVTPAMLHSALAASVPGLPATFSLRVVENNPAIAAIVSWSA